MRQRMCGDIMSKANRKECTYHRTGMGKEEEAECVTVPQFPHLLGGGLQRRSPRFSITYTLPATPPPRSTFLSSPGLMHGLCREGLGSPESKGDQNNKIGTRVGTQGTLGRLEKCHLPSLGPEQPFIILTVGEQSCDGTDLEGGDNHLLGC